MWLTPLDDWWHKTIFKRTFWINKKLLQKWSAIRKSADCTKKITQAKNDYIVKLQNLSTAPKICWAILSRLLCNKKNPAISPLLVDGKRVSDFCKKANLFNSFFINMYTNTKYISVLPPFLYRTNARTTSYHVTKEDMLLLWIHLRLVVRTIYQ